MTAPRQLLPNATYLISRRCSERRMLLAPSEALNEIVRYVLAVAAERFGVLIHAFCFLSNHFHIVLTDPHTRLPQFEQYLASLIARSCNGLHGRWESFWAPGSYSAVRLLDAATILDKIAYTLANPTSAGLVQQSADWDGVWSPPAIMGGRAIRAGRPKHFFRADGTMPDVAWLQVVPPPGTESIDQFRRTVQDLVRAREEEARSRPQAERREVAARRVNARSPNDRPASVEPRRNLNPRIACLDEQRRKEALAELQAFVRAYRAVWREFANGVRHVVFPHGTYWMRVVLGARCASAG